MTCAPASPGSSGSSRCTWSCRPSCRWDRPMHWGSRCAWRSANASPRPRCWFTRTRSDTQKRQRPTESAVGVDVRRYPGGILPLLLTFWVGKPGDEWNLLGCSSQSCSFEAAGWTRRLALKTCGYITQATAPFLFFYCPSSAILRNNSLIITHFKQEDRSTAMMPTDLDRYDLKILAALQENAAISNQELADRISLSPSPCSRRVNQLEEAGYILRQVSLLDPHKLGLTLTAFVMVGMDRHTPDRFAHFQDTIRQCPE